MQENLKYKPPSLAMSTVALGNQALLAKIDRLRELNVGSVVPLPQLVVVGDQSSGKSSVLESLTGFSFPRATGLCTRFATQITCSREPVKSVDVSIIPRPNAEDELKAKLLSFQRRSATLDDEKLATIFYEASIAMGIRTTPDQKDSGPEAFSQDILKIEVNGPEENHLTVIDVPGIFRVPTPGLTTETDIVLVENMVKSYMSHSRTIILAVMPCNVDIATQEILKLAETADPDGSRTMGVLTKPDLVTEAATKAAVMDLVMGKRSNLKLGYWVVKNRSADDDTSTSAQRTASEQAFFMTHPWTNTKDRCGIVALKGRLRSLLTQVSQREFPYVKAEVENRLRLCKTSIHGMGPPRADQNSQRLYLGKLATRFQHVTQAALNGYYSGEDIFKTEPELKLITKIIKLNEVFSNVFWKAGHLQQFGIDMDDDGESVLGDKPAALSFKIPLTEYSELESIIETERYICPVPTSDPIMDRIREVFESSRGPELGTFGGGILSTVLSTQTTKWIPLALSHASKAIALVHDFIFRLLDRLCPEEQVRARLWDNLLVDKLSDTYRKTMDHARFLLHIELDCKPSTYNHYFNAILQKRRAERISKPLRAHTISVQGREGFYAPMNELENCTIDKNNGQQVCEDILDTLASYYQVSRKRFVDVFCQQVISHFLLDGMASPLRIFSPDLVMTLDPEQLETIAGEDEESRFQRHALEREIQNLEEGLKVLRA